MQSQNNQFTIGLTDTIDFTSTSTTIESAYKDISVNITSSSQLNGDDAPTPPSNLTAQATSTTADLTWNAANATAGIARYRISRDGTEVGTTTGTSFQGVGLNPGQTYSFSVIAEDTNGNLSSPATVSITTTQQSSDTVPPSVPAGLILNSATSNAVTFSWNASTDDQGTVVLYHIMRDGIEIGTSSVASYTDSSVAADTAYVYNVSAQDDSGNESAVSSALNVDTSVPSGFELSAGYPFEEGSGIDDS